MIIEYTYGALDQRGRYYGVYSGTVDNYSVIEGEGSALPSEIHLNDLLVLEGDYKMAYMKFTIGGEDFIWDYNRLRQVSTGDIKYVLKDNVMVLQ